MLRKKGLILLFIVALAIAGCSKSNEKDKTTGSEPTGQSSQAANSGAPAKEVEINLLSSWSTDTERGAALKAVIDQFNQTHAGKIKVNEDINPDWPAYQEKVKTMMSADKTPDIFNYNFNPNDLSRQQSGKLLDFTPYMDDAWKARFNEKELADLTINGQLTSIPFEKGEVVFLYNRELFKKAGITSYPKTWDEFFKDCDILKKAGITPISLMTADDAWHAINALTYFAAGAGGADVFKIGNSLNTPEVIKAAEYLKKLFQYTTQDAIGANYSVSTNNFSLGNTAITIDGAWVIGMLDKKTLDAVDVVAGPTFGDGKIKDGFIITDTYAPWSAGKQKSKEKEQAIVEFMKVLTSEESSKQFTLAGHISVSTKLNLTDDELKQAGPVLGEFIKVNKAAPESLIQISRIIKPTAISKLPSLVEGLALNQITPEQFAQQLQEANQ